MSPEKPGRFIEPLAPLRGKVENDLYAVNRSKAGAVTAQLIIDAKAGNLKVETSDGEDAILVRARQPDSRGFGKDFMSRYDSTWFVTRNDLKDWAEKKGQKPAFLFLEVRKSNASQEDGIIDLHDQVISLLTADNLKEWIGRAHKKRFLFGKELLAIIYFDLCDPDDKTIDANKIIPEWAGAIEKLISNDYLTPLDKDTLLPMRKEKASKPGVTWLVSIKECEDAIRNYGLDFSCAKTIELLFNKVFPGGQENNINKTKVVGKKKESTVLTENLYCAFFCLARDGYEYDPNAPKSEVPAKLSKMMLEKYGVDISQKTIKRWLNKGVNLVDQNPQQ